MTGNDNIETRLDQLIAWYGEGSDASSPTRQQWRGILERPQHEPITLINFFKLRRQARYPEAAEASTGQEAFDRYAAVSVPTVEKVGGRFLLLAPFEASFIGETEDWDLVAIGAYPKTSALFVLLEDPDYRAAYPHRCAALERQKVIACSA